MTARERLELAQLLDAWEAGGLSAEERRRCSQLEQMERAAAWRVPSRPEDILAPFFHARRLGDTRPEPAGLPICASPTCRRTFQPTATGQEICHACRVPTVPEVAAPAGGKVVKIGRGKGR